MSTEETQDTRKNNKKPIFRDLNAEDPDPETTVIESLCMNCGENVRFQTICYCFGFIKVM